MKVGDKIKCINCNKEFELNPKTFDLDAEAEYIICPYCNKKFDANVYHSLDINIIKRYLKSRGYDIENPKEERSKLMENNNTEMIEVDIHIEVPKAPECCNCITCAFCNSGCSNRNYPYINMTEQWAFSHNFNQKDKIP